MYFRSFHLGKSAAIAYNNPVYKICENGEESSFPIRYTGGMAMKYVLVIGDGMSDDPIPELGGKTPAGVP